MKTVITHLFMLLSYYSLGQSFTSNPNFLSIPNLSTSQRNNLSNQQAGNIIFNSDNKNINYHNGSNWISLQGEQYSNVQHFTLPQFINANSEFTWNVPNGISKIFVEIYSGGGCGNEYGGGCGGNYGIATIPVSAGQQIFVMVGEGCGRIANNVVSGRESYIRIGNSYFVVKGGGNFNLTSSYAPFTLNIPNANGYAISGESGTSTKNSYFYDGSNYYKRIEYGNGGASPNHNNGGKGGTSQLTLPNNGGSSFGATYGGFPGGGGGGYGPNSNTLGGDGLISIYY
ncbi:hypothetical protein [Emticicia aquatilis]|nr:hypothetical protein [Emticicia aquatilis]